ncbi:MAG: isochorismatase hydrolase [Halomonadaceae bacterium T82-2]|nr:MAG: isochorismatase hydrolase [Halomonadaceae bacterium T82-2]
MPELAPRTTALVLIDLQRGIVGMPLEPRSGEVVVSQSKGLADRFRDAGAPVVQVRVAWSADFADAPPRNVDQPIPQPEGGLPDDWSQFVDGLVKAGDLEILKRQWGAFFGTELDLQLRRRGITTVVLGGIATNFGVESTARQAWERGYDVVVVEDACAGPSRELHEMAMTRILPRLSRVVQSADLALA